MDLQALVDTRLTRFGLAQPLKADLVGRGDYLLTHFTHLALPAAAAPALARQDLSAALSNRFGKPDLELSGCRALFAFSYEGLLVLATTAPGRTDWRLHEERDIPPAHKLRAYSNPWAVMPWCRMCVDLCRALELPVPALNEFPIAKLSLMQGWIAQTNQEAMDAQVPQAGGQRLRL